MGDVTSQAFSAASGSGLSSNTDRLRLLHDRSARLRLSPTPATGSLQLPTVTYTYDQLGNMASETDWLGNEVSFAHDGDGNLTAQDNDVSARTRTGRAPRPSPTTRRRPEHQRQPRSLAQTCGGQESLTQSFSGSGGSRNADGEVTEDTETYGGSCSGQASYERNYSYDLAGQVIYQGSVAQGPRREQLLLRPGRQSDRDIEPRQLWQLRHLRPDEQLGRGGDRPDAHSGHRRGQRDLRLRLQRRPHELDERGGDDELQL